MKREIKFRAWHIATKTMLNIWPYEWKDGVYLSDGLPNKFFDNVFQFSEDKKECNRLEGKSVFITLDGAIVGVVPIGELITRSLNYSEEYELMQFTGLKDKNGKEIYEGDVINYETDRFFIVEWESSMAGLWLRDSIKYDNGTHGFGFESTEKKELEVVGNIYENPDLI